MEGCIRVFLLYCSGGQGSSSLGFLSIGYLCRMVEWKCPVDTERVAAASVEQLIYLLEVIPNL